MPKNTIKNRDIIIVGQQPWDVEIGSNCKNIALEFSKQNRVLYVNSPLDRISSLKKNDPRITKRLAVINNKENGLIELETNLWNLYPDCLVESINWLNIIPVFNFINKINNKRFARSIKKAADTLGFKDYILFNDNEIMKCFYLTELLKPKTSIYYSRDYILATDYWKKHGFRLEPLIIKKNNLCVANSTYLRDYCKQYNPNSFYVGQGCDLEAFQKENLKTPEDLVQIKEPIIGYVGAILESRLDIKVLEHIALSFEDCMLVLVGPEDDAFKNSSLHGLKNVLFTGAKSPDQLPKYINTFSVCINPQIVNQLTIGNYPRKIDEYLAIGKPVVATNTKAMEPFKDIVFLADTKEEYILLLKRSFEANTEEEIKRRKDFAATHSWENSVDEIYQSIISTSNHLPS